MARVQFPVVSPKIVVYPLDTVKKRMQVQAVSGHIQYQNMVDCLHQNCENRRSKDTVQWISAVRGQEYNRNWTGVCLFYSCQEFTCQNRSNDNCTPNGCKSETTNKGNK